MKYLVLILVMVSTALVAGFSYGATFSWKKPAPVAGLTYTRVIIYCSTNTATKKGTVKVVGTAKAVVTTLNTSATSMSRNGLFTCFARSAGFSNVDATKKELFSPKSNTLDFELKNGNVVVGTLLAPSGFGIR